MSKSQRQKGAAGEREWCRVLGVIGLDAERHLGQARDGGGDVIVPPYLWEVKRHARFSVYDFVRQAEAAAEGTELTPAVALRGDGGEWLVLMRARDVLPLLYNKRAAP